jgi:DNA-binding NarL/FixJ family response regulator
VKVLLVAADPAVRRTMQLTVRSVERSAGPDEEVEFVEASDGIEGIRLAWRERPDVVVADELSSRAGAFALTKDLKDAIPAFPGKVVILLERSQDEWLAPWAGADAWFVKPVNPFELADAITALVGVPRREAV